MARLKPTIKAERYSFDKAPQGVNISRSKFDLSHTHTTTMPIGKLVPVLAQEVLPGDTWTIRPDMVARLLTPKAPTFGDLYLDCRAFFVPRRQVWDSWQEFCGENKTGYWTQTTSYSIPQLMDNSNDDYPVYAGSVLDHMGIPPGNGRSVDACYARAYVKIWNEYYRDENLQPAAALYTGDNNTNIGDLSDPYTEAQKGGALLPVCRLGDVFSRALPAPQKGPDIGIPINALITNDTAKTVLFQPRWYNSSGAALGGDLGAESDGDTVASSTAATGTAAHLSLRTTAGQITVSDMRIAFALQRMQERMARGGTRYRELLMAFFGVRNGDDRMQVPEELGHVRQRLNMQQVVQTSASNISGSDTPQGSTAAYSLTGMDGLLCDKSFTEHGILLVVACVRAAHVYQQGVPRQFSRHNFVDFYLPAFAHLSEVAVLTKEIYASGIQPQDESVFGYQEAWYEYRSIPNQVSGEMRSSHPQSLDIWHYADDYASRPYLDSTWIEEPRANVDRTLVYGGSNHDELLLCAGFNIVADRPMPVHSIPGLIDHY